jgi:alpha-ribazole phosphatase
MSAASTLIDLIRHGEPVGGRAYRGHGIDDPLSETGWMQMWNAVGDQAPWQQIVTSPMRRCQEFAQALAEKHGLPLATIQDLREVGFGTWEGKAPDELKREHAKEFEDFYLDPVNCRPQGAEPLADFIDRVTRAWNGILNQFTGQHVLVVAHAGVIRAVVAHVLHSEPVGMYRIQIDNAGISRIRHDGGTARLLVHNVAKLG